MDQVVIVFGDGADGKEDGGREIEITSAAVERVERDVVLVSEPDVDRVS
eukprot:CAMPEP_0184361590 /NCGR_PEP_ID=MMETSP1089-20130417/131035_1 /TAXON_ID=38269 ORGANISM="Gloeochaete wittrockiana, Strain SAG46.84" /NCGR_SAMPLE_ID=MMETSP1089 /ASSEMBLY_ACC=CAM_ASM_000445 /LENGTH=48 /DNA_ID= /DNA_START= /DNA_END= /DNA_ORIENTATION=